jgi:hypothetical protein
VDGAVNVICTSEKDSPRKKDDGSLLHPLSLSRCCPFPCQGFWKRDSVLEIRRSDELPSQTATLIAHTHKDGSLPLSAEFQKER